MVASAGPRKKTRSRILNRLQAPEQVVVNAIEQRVTVVQATGYECLAGLVSWRILRAVIWSPDAADGAGSSWPGIAQ